MPCSQHAMTQRGLGAHLSAPHVAVELFEGGGGGQVPQALLLHHGEGEHGHAARGRGDALLPLQVDGPP